MTTRPVADELMSVLELVLGGPVPLGVQAWDGSRAGPAGRPTLVLRNRQALRRMVWRPDEIGLARAYVSGDLDIQGDLSEVVDAVVQVVRDARDGPKPAPTRPARVRRRLDLLARAVRLGALGPPPPPPPEESPARRGRRHTRARDATAIAHHYDVGNDFYRIVLGESMVYSCAYWTGGPDRPGGPDGPDGLEASDGLDGAQRDKLDLVSRKLSLAPGKRLLDVGCGWGSMVLHAARDHGVRAVGITLSHEQADLARKRVADAGLQHLVEIRVQDYRDVVDGPFDVVSSIGMAEHVGHEELDHYARSLAGLLAPGGRLLHHAIAARAPLSPRSRRGFMDAYVFPDGELLPLGQTVSALELAGLEVRDVQALREHYSLTLRAWSRRLQADRDRAVTLVGEGRTRVWLAYMAASALAFDADRCGVDQVLAVKPDDGVSGVPMVREQWLGRVETVR